MTLHRLLTSLACVYTAATLILTGLLIVLGARAADITGLHRQVYAGVGFQGMPIFDDINSDVTLDLLVHDRTLPRRYFGVRWQGFWYLPEAGPVELRGDGDDRLDVWLDGQLLIHRRAPAAMQVETVMLDAGVHEIRVDYEQLGGEYAIWVDWKVSPNLGHDALPSHYLFHEYPNSGDIRAVQYTASLEHIVPPLWAALIAFIFFWLATSPIRDRRTGLGTVLAGTAWCIAVSIFLKNAWLGDDAYSVFRSIEQVFAGNGPVWNPHERAQAFTSPLWFGVLLLSRIASANLYLNVILISLALWAITVRNLQQLSPSSAAFATGILLCVASSAINDYTSSGLENVLAYALVTYFLLQIVRLYRGNLQAHAVTRALGRLCLAVGLLAITRHDLVLLILPPATFVVWDHRRLLSVRRWCSLSAAAILPLAFWTLFSLVYYGFPWPNTAYAKLGTGMDRGMLVVQGFRYLYVALLQDAITPLIIVAGLIISQVATRHTVYRFIGLGIVLNLVYVVWIGGDFMMGRFLSYSCLLAVGLCVLEFPSISSLKLDRRVRDHADAPRARLPVGTVALTGAAVVMYAVLYPHTPVNCWRPDHEHVSTRFGITSQRDYYAELSLSNYLLRPARDGVWPDHRRARYGLDILDGTDRVHVRGAIGMLGYMAGTDKIIVDIHALVDPFLARLPADTPRNWRPGHLTRALPAGYLERLENVANHPSAHGRPESGSGGETEWREHLGRAYPIVPPELNEFYNRLAIVTQSDDLWSIERLKTILLFNLGAYDRLVRPSVDPKGRLP